MIEYILYALLVYAVACTIHGFRDSSYPQKWCIFCKLMEVVMENLFPRVVQEYELIA